MQTIFRKDPFTGQMKSYVEYSPQEIEAVQLAQHIGLITSGRIARPMVGSVRMDEFVPDTGTRRNRSRG